MSRLRERRIEGGREGSLEHLIEDKIKGEALASARFFYQENRNNPWILIAGPDISYYFNQVSRDLPLTNELDFYAVAGLLEDFREQFNIELRRLIIDERDREIEALQNRLLQVGLHPLQPTVGKRLSDYSPS